MVVATGRGLKRRWHPRRPSNETEVVEEEKIRFEIGILKGTGRRGLALGMAEPESESCYFRRRTGVIWGGWWTGARR